MLDRTKHDQEKVWSIVKRTRLSFLTEQSYPDCQDDDTLLTNTNIQNNINSLAGELELNTTSTPDINVLKRTLKTAAEMFTYLNYCPPKLISFSKHVFQTGTPREIILALTSAIKTSQNVNKKDYFIEIFSIV